MLPMVVGSEIITKMTNLGLELKCVMTGDPVERLIGESLMTGQRDQRP